MNRLAFLGGIGIGAGLVRLLGPGTGRGNRRRAQAVVARRAQEAGAGLAVAFRDLGHRAQGLAARLRPRPRVVSDETVRARVRTALGRATTHPRAVDVVCHAGELILSGAVLAREHRGVLEAVARVRGVRSVVDGLRVHEHAGHVPELQGGRRAPDRRPNVLQRHWDPATRLLVGTAAVGVAAVGLRAGGGAGVAIGGLGALLLGRSLLNVDLRRITGVGAGRHAVDLQKTIHVEAPVEEVFALWSDLERFPRYMTHVAEVRRTPAGQYRWRVDAPAGTFEWTAEITAFVPNEVIAWRSVGGAVVENAGCVRFRPDGRGGTELDIHLAYNPPGGLLGHGLAKLLGSDPRKQMDDDMLRFKSLLEQGKATGRAGAVTRAEIAAEGAAHLGASDRRE
jgi:uncharacterized membrane protein